MTLREYPEHKLHWNLLHNGIDFIRAGVEAYFDTSEPRRWAGPGPFGAPALHEDDLDLNGSSDSASEPRPDHAYKYALLHLHAGCLLLFKERLRREHECLVYENIDANFSSTKKPPRTVDFDQALGRLAKWTPVRLTPQDTRRLRRLQKERNDVEHFEVKIDKRHAESIVTRVVEFATTFLRDELGTKLEDEVSVRAWEKVSKLRKIAERLRQEEIEAWKQRVAHYSGLSDADLGALGEIEDFHPRHNPHPEKLEWCDSCCQESLKLVAPDMYVCTNPDCREILEAEPCLTCSATSLPGSIYCEDCEGYYSHLASKD